MSCDGAREPGFDGTTLQLSIDTTCKSYPTWSGDQEHRSESALQKPAQWAFMGTQPNNCHMEFYSLATALSRPAEVRGITWSSRHSDLAFYVPA